MSSTEKVIEAGQKKGILKKTKKKGYTPWTVRTLKWLDDNIFPYIAKATVVAGFMYGVVKFMEHFNRIPQQGRGAVEVIIILAIVSRAAKKRK